MLSLLKYLMLVETLLMMKKLFDHFKSPPLSSKNTSEELHEFWNDSFCKIDLGSTLSEIEQQDCKLRSSQFPTIAQTSMESSLDFLLKSCKSPEDKKSDRGSPVIIIVCQSAIRCVNVLKELSEVKSKHRIAKLFAKHIKLQEQIRDLKSRFVSIAVGTPGRLFKLTEEHEGFLRNLCFVVVDCSFKDANERNIFQIAETRNDLFKFIHSQQMLAKRPEIILH